MDVPMTPPEKPPIDIRANTYTPDRIPGLARAAAFCKEDECDYPDCNCFDQPAEVRGDVNDMIAQHGTPTNEVQNPVGPAYFVGRCTSCATYKDNCEKCGGSGFCIFEAIYEGTSALGSRYIAQAHMGEVIAAGWRPPHA